jgi:glycosyltransferase involved in cell wall biosynthesis
MKIAIVHDYLIDFGGAERVLLALHEIYPKAPIYVLINRKNYSKNFSDAKIIQSWFGKIPFAEKLISPLRFLIPMIWRSFDFRNYDVIISSASWAVTKGFDKNKSAIEICYCHTPPRYLYGYDSSRKFTGVFGSFVSFYHLIVNHFMRQYDFKSAQKVDYFIANSEEVKKRIEKFYRRDSTVIYPPVEIPDVRSHSTPGVERGYFLAGGRLVAAKNFDLIIKTFNKLKLPLKIYGDGVLKHKLKSMANKNIEFFGRVDDAKLADLYSGAKAFLLAQKDEDFGMTAVESMAYGTPVIAFRGGGYIESVIENKTGLFFDDLTIESLSDAIKKFEKMKFNPEDSITQTKKFSRERFKKEMLEFVKSHARTS